MITRTFISALFILSSVMSIANGIGTWRNYLAYSDVTEIEQGSGNILYVLASNGLYTYNTNDQSIQTFDKVNGLSDCIISHIKWNKNTKNLIIVYDNANIDIMYGNSNSDIVNISDYYSKSMTEDKTVNNIYIYGKHALMATAFGIVDVNMENCEISNTYNIGINVDYCYIENNTLYAASKKSGMYTCSINQNMLDKNNWKRTANYTAQKTEDKTELFNIANTLKPGGPKFNNFGFMKFANGQLYTSGAGYNILQDLRLPGCIQVYNNNDWTFFEDDIQKLTGVPFIDINSVAINPLNPDTVFCSGRTGLYQFVKTKFYKHYSYDNSPLVSAFGTDKNYVVIQGITYNTQGNLWILNSMSNTENILAFEHGEWSKYSKNELKAMANLCNPFIDSRNYLWFCNDNWKNPAIYKYDINNNILYTYTSFENQDGTTLNIKTIGTITEDLNKNIWIGTNVGPILIEQNETYKDIPTFTQVKVPRNDGTNYADYLLNGINIRNIAIDNGNRKWFGTEENGVFLINNDNINQIKHFTKDNSDLLSNSILSIAINENTGEVFFGTSKGLCSYMSDASKAAEVMNKDNVYAYPNPVRPDYTGLITIVGLSMNADVKVVTSSGALVAQGRSNGGSFTWDGNDLSGKRVASGVYMVEAATETGEKGVVCKIAIVN